MPTGKPFEFDFFKRWRLVPIEMAIKDLYDYYTGISNEHTKRIEKDETSYLKFVNDLLRNFDFPMIEKIDGFEKVLQPIIGYKKSGEVGVNLDPYEDGEYDHIASSSYVWYISINIVKDRLDIEDTATYNIKFKGPNLEHAIEKYLKFYRDPETWVQEHWYDICNGGMS